MRYNMISRIFLSFILAVVVGSSNASAVTVYLNQSLSSIAAGQTFDIDVIVDPHGTAIAGANLDILFNNSLLSINKITEGNLFNQNGESTIFYNGTIDNLSGKVNNIYGSILGPHNVITRGTFIAINVTAINYITTFEINLDNFKIVNSYGNQVYPVPVSTPDNPSWGNNTVVSSNDRGSEVTSGESYINIESTEKYDLYIYRDVTTSYIFRKLTNPVVFVNITGNTNSTEITTSVEILKGTSTLARSPPHELVYKNINIWVGTFGYATPKNIKHAEIIFKVPVEWISANNFDPDSIEMMRYDDDKWQSLPTRKIGTNKNDIMYEASTTGFSIFAITGKKPTGKMDYKLYNNSGTALNIDPQEEQQIVNNSGTTPISKKESNYNNYLAIAIAGILVSSILSYKIRMSKKK